MTRSGRRKGRKSHLSKARAPIDKLPNELVVTILAWVPDGWRTLTAHVCRLWRSIATARHHHHCRDTASLRLDRTLMAKAMAEGQWRTILCLHDTLGWPWSAMTSITDATRDHIIACALIGGGLRLARRVGGASTKMSGPCAAAVSVALGDANALRALGVSFTGAADEAADQCAMVFGGVPLGIPRRPKDGKTGCVVIALARKVWSGSPSPLAVVLAASLRRDDILNAMDTPFRVRVSARRAVERAMASGLCVYAAFASTRVDRIISCAMRHKVCGRVLALDVLSILS
ncbi:hypothetical protein psal_cds_1301 [Pandoravirus salinus]|uniref:Uncharacterized protein n=1 Tax=Pandoravirus salinus TaxID=1349410 RepID=S4W5M8_9VIRU|nr:hypothetical protein psal_cds_1301 [Pandoravirus salinus]AGO85675.1 hypothetical protein psal_cds_1301 [Pandoravirus salinus]